MAESQKGPSLLADLKDKKSFLDEEIGKDFLCSWKSMSMAEDDALDFNFDKVSTGKKKAFNFDKLDMDLNLDGDFDKLSSFKVDMPDLDFSCTSEKDAKDKDQFEGETSSGKNKGKQDPFTFSFDFDALDGFSFSSPAKKGEKSPVNDLDSKESDLDSNGYKVSKVNLAIDDLITNDDRAKGSTASGNVNALLTGIVESGVGTRNSVYDNLPLKAANPGDLVVSHGARVTTSTDQKLANGPQVTDQQIQGTSIERPLLNEPLPQQIAHGLPIKSLGTNDSVADVHGEANCMGKEVNSVPDADNTINCTVVAGIVSEFNQDNSRLNDSASTCITGSDSKHTGKEKEDFENPIEKTVDGRLEACEVVNASFNAGISCTMLQDCKENKDMEDLTEKLQDPVGSNPVMVKEKQAGVVFSKFFNSPREIEGQQCHLLASAKDNTLVSKCHSLSFTRSHECRVNKDTKDLSEKLTNPVPSEAVGGKMMPVKEKEPLVIRSKFFSRSKENQGHPCHSSGSEGVGSLGNKGTSINFSPVDGKRRCSNVNDDQTATKLVADSKSSDDLTKVPTSLLGNEKHVKNLHDATEGSTGKGTRNSGNEIIDGVIHVKERNPAVLESKKSMEDFYNLSRETKSAGSSGKTTKIDNVTNLKSKNVFPTIDLQQKMNSVKGNETEMSKPGLLSLKIPRIIGASKDQSNATLKRFVTSVKKSEGNMDLQGSKSPKIASPVTTAERKAPLLTSLKRKTLEPSNVDKASLNPPKRLSPSPSANSRNFEKLPENKVNEQVSNHDRVDSTTKKVFNHQTCPPGAVMPWEVNLEEQEIALAVENDGIVEKAEAYTKELDNICNMLKKKQEEAKELLVRAIVNNNNLLMLNHPIFDEKIRLAEKFAEKLALD